MYLYHYFDKRSGPFKSLTSISPEKAEVILKQINTERPNGFCAKRDEKYLERRKKCELILRHEFMAKGGVVKIDSPYYMVVDHCPWLSTWFEQSDYLKIPVEEFDIKTLSFTYGDSMPTFSPLVNDGKEY